MNHVDQGQRGVASADVVRCPSCGKANRLPAAATGAVRCGVCHVDLPWLVAAEDGDFDVAIGVLMPVLVDLWAPWCAPCRMVAPGVERAAHELAGRLKVVNVNVDKAPGVSARFAVQSIPTLLILRNGHPIARQVGALPADRLVDWARQAVESSAPPTGSPR